MSNHEIEQLTPLEHVRLRPGMYVGDCSTPTQLLVEILANAIDEHNAGYGDIITVDVDRNGWCKVTDRGRGFPIDEVRDKENHITTLQIACDTPNTSGKFRDDGTYNGVSTGCNGLGMVLTNFLSHRFIIISHRNGHKEELEFAEGVLINRKLSFCARKSSGTTISFLPNESFFISDKIDLKRIKAFCNEILCFIGPKLTILLNGETLHQESKDGIQSLLLNGISKEQDLLLPDQFFIADDIRSEDGRQRLQIGITWVKSEGKSLFKSYVNYGATDSGIHQSAIKTAITRIFNQQSGDIKIDGVLLHNSMRIVSNLISPGVGYDAQVKSRVTKVPTDFIQSLSQSLSLWLNNHSTLTKTVIEHVTEMKKANDAVKAYRNHLKANKENNKIKVTISKLADCNSRDRSQCEIYITEGDSASGGARMVRDAKTQAILSIRGKILNACTAPMNRIKANSEIVDIITALGFATSWSGNKISYSAAKMRYGKVIIAADRDKDGEHIQSLLLTLFWTLLPQMVLDGFVYIAYPALYKAEWGKQYQYLESKRALDVFKRDHDKFTLSYFKGLGECSPQELYGMILDPATRDIRQITVDDIPKASEIVDTLMGRKIEEKRKVVFGEQ